MVKLIFLTNSEDQTGSELIICPIFCKKYLGQFSSLKYKGFCAKLI